MEYVKVSKFVLGGAQASCSWNLSPLISISDDDLIWSLKCQIGTQVQIAKQLSARKMQAGKITDFNLRSFKNVTRLGTRFETMH